MLYTHKKNCTVSWALGRFGLVTHVVFYATSGDMSQHAQTNRTAVFKTDPSSTELGQLLLLVVKDNRRNMGTVLVSIRLPSTVYLSKYYVTQTSLALNWRHSKPRKGAWLQSVNTQPELPPCQHGKQQSTQQSTLSQCQCIYALWCEQSTYYTVSCLLGSLNLALHMISVNSLFVKMRLGFPPE